MIRQTPGSSGFLGEFHYDNYSLKLQGGHRPPSAKQESFSTAKQFRFQLRALRVLRGKHTEAVLYLHQSRSLAITITSTVSLSTSTSICRVVTAHHRRNRNQDFWRNPLQQLFAQVVGWAPPTTGHRDELTRFSVFTCFPEPSRIFQNR